MNLQTRYDLEVAEDETGAKVERGVRTQELDAAR
jgi:plasmid maintenance system antidote protein VapI